MSTLTFATASPPELGARSISRLNGMNLTISDWLTLVGMFSTILISVGSFAWWLGKQFSSVRKLVYEKIEQVQKLFTDKLEYHERHDEIRFNTVTNDLWDIRVRNAARDGIQIKDRKR